VVVATDNSELKLLPYLTASLQFERDSRTNVLLVPNAALRWQPRSRGGQSPSEREASRAVGSSAPAPDKTRGNSGRLFVRDGTGVRALEVTIGLSDGVQTEVTGDELREGLEVVVADMVIEKPTGGSPFAPATAPRSATGGGPGGR